MADADSSGFDVSQILAPWMSGGNPWDPSTYGGAGNMGAAFMAAAGPTPYRVPFGVALGKAMQGGQANALQMARARMGATGDALGMQRSVAMFPYQMAYLSRLAALSGAGGGSPNASPADNGGATTPGSTSDTSGTTSPASGSTNQPPPWVDPNAPPPYLARDDSSSGPAPGVSPPAAANSSPSQVDMGPRSNPFGTMSLAAFGGAMGMPGAAQLSELGKTQLQYDPALATSMEYAKSAPAQDLLAYSRALEASGGKPNPAAQAFLNKFQTDTGMQHIGSMSGIFTKVESDGSVTTYNPSTGLRVNSRTGAQYMPGALQAFAQREAAEKYAGTRAELGAETAPADGSGIPGAGAGGGDVVPPLAPSPAAGGPRVPRRAPAPAAAPVAGAAPAQFQGAGAFNAQNFIPPVLQQPARIPLSPGNTGLGALSTFQKDVAANAPKVAEDLQGKAEDAQTLLAQSQQIRAAAAEFTPGRYAAIKGEFMSALQGLPGGDTLLGPNGLNSLGSYQEGTKLSIQMQAMVTKQLGSREAQQIFQTMGKSIPGLTLSADGLQKISAYLEGVGRYNIARATFAERLQAQNNVAGLNSLPQTFQQSSNPLFYILASASPQVRQEMVNAIPSTQRAQLAQQWDRAIKLGLAPRPDDYYASTPQIQVPQRGGASGSW